MRKIRKLAALIMALQLFLPLRSEAMNMRSYDLASLVYLSTDIVVARLSVDQDNNFIATVTESLYGSLKAGDTIGSLGIFLGFFRPMKSGMRVVLFLDRRPRKLGFPFSDLTKLPFSIPPSGVYLIDPYDHVHSYTQVNNPGSYIASGYFRMRGEAPEITREQALKYPSLDQIQHEIVAAIAAVSPLRPLLDNAPKPSDAPALLSLADQTSPRTDACEVHTASAIAERVAYQITALQSAQLLLQAHALSGNAMRYFSGSAFTINPDLPFTREAQPAKLEFARSRVRFLLLALADRKQPLPLRVSALQLLLGISSESHPNGGYATPQPLDGPAVSGMADEIRKLAQSIFIDETEDGELRALALKLLPIDVSQPGSSPELLASIRQIYSHTVSSRVRYAVEDTFLTVSDDLYAALHSSGGPIAGVLLPIESGGCAKRTVGTLTIEYRYHQRKDFQPSSVNHRKLLFTNSQTGTRISVEPPPSFGGFGATYYGEYRYDVLPPPGIMPGTYYLSFELTFGERTVSVSQAMTVDIVSDAAGQLSFR